MKTLRTILVVTLTLALLFTAWYIGQKFSLPGKQSTEHSEVILEKVKSACKLVTAEGYISEVYDYKDYYHFDIAPLRKKALIRVKAKVSVGFDLEKLKIDADEINHIIRISNFPKAEVIAIDHDLDYYDLSEGTFNNFSEADLTTLNVRAKEYVRKIALDGDLVAMAEAKSNELIDLIRFISEKGGWKLEIEGLSPILN